MIEATTMQFGEKRQANFSIRNGRKELSVCVDNGPRAVNEKMWRSDIRCFNGKKDVTGEVFGCSEHEVVRGCVETMAKAMNWLQLKPWGMEAQV